MNAIPRTNSRIAIAGGNTADPSPLTAIVARIETLLLRIFRGHTIALNRTYERCGKAACRRSRRCRGFTCDWECEPGDSRV